MLALTLSVLIAAAAASTGPTSEFTGNTMIVLGQVVTMIVAVGGLLLALLGMRRQPPIAEEMHKEFVRRREWEDSIQRLHDRIDKALTKVGELQDHQGKVTNDMERALGNLEGTLKSMREYFKK